MALTSQQVRQAAPAARELQFPFLDLKAEFASIRAEILPAVERVLESQQFILGPEVEALEADVAGLVGCRYAIGCASGSDALLLALMALEIGAGDEVITTPFTFVATVGSIARLGARPVLVDVSPDDFNLDPRQIEKAITRRTRAIMPVHLFGQPAKIDAILEIALARRIPRTTGLFSLDFITEVIFSGNVKSHMMDSHVQDPHRGADWQSHRRRRSHLDSSRGYERSCDRLAVHPAISRAP